MLQYGISENWCTYWNSTRHCITADTFSAKNCEETERSSISCGPFSKQWKSVKYLPLGIDPQTAPTSRRRTYISLLICTLPEFWFCMVRLADLTGNTTFYFSVYNLAKTFTLWRHFCHGGTKFTHQAAVLLSCSEQIYRQLMNIKGSSSLKIQISPFHVEWDENHVYVERDAVVGLPGSSPFQNCSQFVSASMHKMSWKNKTNFYNKLYLVYCVSQLHSVESKSHSENPWITTHHIKCFMVSLSPSMWLAEQAFK